MSRPVAPRERLATRVIVGGILLLLAWIVIRMALGFVYSIVRSLVFLALFAVVAWIVLVGPPGRRE
jgi:hypothetical protein